MTAYYNEHDIYAAQWLRNLIDAGHIAPGIVDERSIEDVTAGDLAGFTQCHFFAGIGVWSLALRRAGWPDDRPVWTGSCPCQPFSAAGAGSGFADPRHLWPVFAWLIDQCRPAVVFGEQVASKAVEPWVDLVHADLEAMGYAFGAVPFPSAGVGAPHIRDRLYWLGHTNDSRSQGHARNGGAARGARTDRPVTSAGLSDFEQPPAGAVNGFWGYADWLNGRDGNWRPVEPGTCPLADGAASRMVCVCPDCKTETVIYEGMHSLRNVPGRDKRCGSEEILRQGMLQAASFVAAAHEQEHRALPGASCGKEQILQSMRGNYETGSASSGPGRTERQSEQLGENLFGLSRPRAPGNLSNLNMRSVWDELHRSLASEPKQDLFCPLCKRVGPQECAEEVGGERVGRLRAYGNAINAQAAQEFIGAYLDSAVTPP